MKEKQEQICGDGTTNCTIGITQWITDGTGHTNGMQQDVQEEIKIQEEQIHTNTVQKNTEIQNTKKEQSQQDGTTISEQDGTQEENQSHSKDVQNTNQKQKHTKIWCIPDWDGIEKNWDGTWEIKHWNMGQKH